MAGGAHPATPRPTPRPDNFESIKAMTDSETWKIDSTFKVKMSPLRSATQSDDVTLRGNKVMIAKWRPSWIRHLGFLDFPKTLGTSQN